MAKLYFVRHGETVWNAENKICGATDSPLTERGREQARETGAQILSMGIKADVILYSPLSRARDTALILSEMTKIPAREEMRLFEQNFGKYESTPRDGAEFREAKKQFLNRYEGGESMFQLAQRIYNLLDELRADEDKTYLLVAHNGIARVVHSYFFEMSNDEYAAFGIKNCEVREYDFKRWNRGFGNDCMKISYVTLENVATEVLYEANLKTMNSNSLLKKEINPGMFNEMLSEQGYDPSISVGAFDANTGECVGMILNSIRKDEERTAYDILTCTIPEYRRRGIARAMFEKVFVLLRERGMEIYTTETKRTNTVAQSMYRSLGFEITKEIVTTLKTPNGTRNIEQYEVIMKL